MSGVPAGSPQSGYTQPSDHAMVQDRIPQSALDWSLGRLPWFLPNLGNYPWPFPHAVLLISTVVALVEIVVATLVAHGLYREEEKVAAVRPIAA